MTLLPWAWFVAGTLAGSMVLAAVLLLWVKACRRAADRVRVIRFAYLGLLAVVLMQLAGWVPRYELGRQHAPRAEAAGVGVVGVAAPVESFPPTGVAVWPAVVWLGGSVGIAAMFVRRRVRLARCLGRLPMWTGTTVRQRVAEVAARLGVKRTPVILVGRGGCSPFVCGVLRPVLVLPPDFDRLLTPEQQEAVLAHELGHLAARDPLWAVVGELVAAVTWWNPVGWWVRSAHQTACETAADDATVALADGPGLLAESLFVLAGRMAGVRAVPAVVGGGCRSALARRVRRLLVAVPAAPMRGSLRRVAAGVGLACGVAVAVVAGMALVRTAGGQDGSSLAHRLWAVASPPSVDTRPPVPQTLGDLHPDLLTDPEYADMAGYRLSVVRPGVDGRIAGPAAADRPATEDEAFEHVGVSAEQREKLLAIQAERWEETKAMYRAPHEERFEQGMEINRRWRAGLRAVLTEDQYRRYLEFWRDRPVVAVKLPR